MTIPALIGNVYVDAVTRLTHSAPLSMTSHPIEDGSLVAEFIVDEEETLTMDCTFTDDGLGYFGPDTAAVRARNRLTTAADKEAAIRQIKATKAPVNITTAKEHFEQFVLIDIQSDVEVQTSSAFKATLVFQKVKTSTLKTSTLPLDEVKKKTKAVKKQTPTVDEGKKETEPVDPDSPEQAAIDAKKSLLASAAGGEV